MKAAGGADGRIRVRAHEGRQGVLPREASPLRLLSDVLFEKELVIPAIASFRGMARRS